MITMSQPRQDPPLLDASTRLAIARTSAAYERTMLSWVRTATSLITFGFGVYKFFQIERKSDYGQYLIGAQEFGLTLVGLGLLSLCLATLEFRYNIRRLGVGYAVELRSPAVLFAAVLSLLGVAAFIIMLMRQ